MKNLITFLVRKSEIAAAAVVVVVQHTPQTRQVLKILTMFPNRSDFLVLGVVHQRARWVACTLLQFSSRLVLIVIVIVVVVVAVEVAIATIEEVEVGTRRRHLTIRRRHLSQNPELSSTCERGTNPIIQGVATSNSYTSQRTLHTY